MSSIKAPVERSSRWHAQASIRDREIVAASVIGSGPGRNWVTLEIQTGRGVHGLGDATLNGRDADCIEDLWQCLYRRACWRRGPVTMTAIVAVDVALWDILGKMTGMPLYPLPGGHSREGARVYARANGRDISEASDEVGKGIEQGLQAVRATSFHGATDVSPVCMGAARPFDTWLLNFGIQEYLFHSDLDNEVFSHNDRFIGVQVGDTPGHGPGINEKPAARFPCVRRQRPVARLEDGAMWDW